MIEYDERVGMWFAHYVNKFGRTKRRWFETRRALVVGAPELSAKIRFGIMRTTSKVAGAVLETPPGLA